MKYPIGTTFTSFYYVDHANTDKTKSLIATITAISGNQYFIEWVYEDASKYNHGEWLSEGKLLRIISATLEDYDDEDEWTIRIPVLLPEDLFTL